MKTVQGVMLWVSIASGCAADGGEYFPPVDFSAVDAVLTDLLGNWILSYPAAMRATRSLECDRSPVCSDGGQEASTCWLNEPGFQAAFADRFTACTLACGELPVCYEEAVAQVPENSAASACSARVLECQIETDACVALRILPKEPLAAAMQTCLSESCETLRACLAGALIKDGMPETDAGTP